MKDSNISQRTHDSPFHFALPSQCYADINRVYVAPSMSTAASCVEVKDAYQLSRIKATEVLIWILADNNRMWQPEIPHALPVAYPWKGYRVSTAKLWDGCVTMVNRSCMRSVYLLCAVLLMGNPCNAWWQWPIINSHATTTRCCWTCNHAYKSWDNQFPFCIQAGHGADQCL